MRDDEAPRSTSVGPPQSRSGWMRVATAEQWEGPDGPELEIQVCLDESPQDNARVLIETVGEAVASDESTAPSPEGSLLPVESPVAGRSLRGTALGLAVAVASLSITLALVWGGRTPDVAGVAVLGSQSGVARSTVRGVVGASRRQVATEVDQGANTALGPALDDEYDGELDEVLDIDQELPGEQLAGRRVALSSARGSIAPEHPTGAGRALPGREQAPDHATSSGRARIGAAPAASDVEPSSAPIVDAGAPSPPPLVGSSGVTASVGSHRGLSSDTHVLLEQRSPY